MNARVEIEAMLAGREDALARGDLNRLMNFCTEDYELITGEMPKLSGRNAVRELFASMFEESSLEATLAVEDLRVSGTLAVVYARELLTLHGRIGGALDQFAMRHMAVLTRGEDGWKFSRSMLSLEGPGVADGGDA